MCQRKLTGSMNEKNQKLTLHVSVIYIFHLDCIFTISKCMEIWSNNDSEDKKTFIMQHKSRCNVMRSCDKHTTVCNV